MLFLKKLYLKKYCSYEEHEFNFVKPDGSPYKYICFFGPNGSGKSTLLEAISMLTQSTHGRTLLHVRESLQKCIRNIDYDPTYNRLINKGGSSGDMVIEGTYDLNGKEYVVRITPDGWVRNDFAPQISEAGDVIRESPWGSDHLKYWQRICHVIRTDSDLSFHKFQLVYDQIENFENIISEIMRYPAKCIKPTYDSESTRTDNYCSDYVITKKDHKIHFKRMSAGEKKISKSFSELLNMIYSLEHPGVGEIAMPGWPRLLLLDNIEMHVYYDRHVRLVECIKKTFSNQQIFATTHSGVLIKRFLDNENDQQNELMIDVEKINS